MKHLYKISCVAALLLTMVVSSTRAQLVVNYQNDEGAPETIQATTLTVVQEGLAFIINNLFDISKINYIARFVSEDTNEGTVTLPEESELTPEEITVLGDSEEVTVDENGNFQTTANNLVAVNEEGQVVYRTIVSLEEGEQMRDAELNAKETAISLLLPMFSNIYQGMPDGVMAQLKRLIGELPETDAMAEAIDKSIVKNKFLDMNDIESEFDAAVKKIGEVSGLGSVSTSSARKARARRVAAADAAIKLKSLTRANVTVNDMTRILRQERTLYGSKGVFDVWNKNRLCYSVVKTGRKMVDGRVMPVDLLSVGYRVLPPVRVSRFIDNNTTWAEIKAFLTGSSTGGSEYEESKISDVQLDFSTNDDVVLISGPGDDTFVKLYNVTRTNMAIVVSDIINILKNGGSDVQDQFYLDFAIYLYNYNSDIVDPDDPDSRISSFDYFFRDTFLNNEMTTGQKYVRIFKVTFPLLQNFIKEGAESAASEQTKDLLKKMDTEAAEKVFGNYNFYLALAEAYGDNTLGATGMEEGFTNFDVEGLSGIEQPAPTADEVAAEMAKVYDMYIDTGNKNNGAFTPGSNFFYKPQMLLGTHTTLDTQGTGWDQKFNQQDWDPNNAELYQAFDLCYGMIGAINELLADLAITQNATFDGEARALRAYYYIFLAQNWGRVPLRDAGETLNTIQNKPYPETDDEMWDFIIKDLTTAVSELGWTPRDNQQGRCTKGMALAYLAEAYLWKAYKARQNGDGDTNFVQQAADVLKQIIESGQYELAPCYSTLWDGDVQWPKEAIWQFVNEMDPTASAWTRNDWAFIQFYTATPECGGWGSEYLSWELYFLYEQGDKRRDASLCTLPAIDFPEAYKSPYAYGKNPFTQEYTYEYYKKYGTKTSYYWYGGEFAPGIWTTKLWRLQRANWAYSYSPVHIYFKRYAGILLDYAECLFRLNGGDSQEAWTIIDQIRNRAFGNMEVGLNESDYIGYFNKLSAIYSWDSKYPYEAVTSYPIPFNTTKVDVEDAKTYYTNMTNEGLQVNITGTPETLCKPFKGKAEAWQVALAQERRKEFSSEWNLKADLQRLDFLATHIECNYPKGVGSENPDVTEWHTYRDWDFNPQKLLMPIPDEEILRNKYAHQNKAYE